ncbi:MAG: DUF448 domain-containing protein [Campylobacterales bacterium]|nr:DUF448 domain-containing protein [Campylobacterales bacterium]
MKICVRMCICCKNRFEQKNLLRLQYLNKKLQKYTNYGRSFYICHECLNQQNNKKLLNSILNICKTKDKEKILLDLKEISLDSTKSTSM